MVGSIQYRKEIWEGVYMVASLADTTQIQAPQQNPTPLIEREYANVKDKRALIPPLYARVTRADLAPYFVDNQTEVVARTEDELGVNSPPWFPLSAPWRTHGRRLRNFKKLRSSKVSSFSS